MERDSFDAVHLGGATGMPHDAIFGRDAWYYRFPDNQIPATAATALIVTHGSTATVPTRITDPRSPGCSRLRERPLARAPTSERSGRRRAGRYLPREVFFFGFGFPSVSLPAAAARAFCFFVATRPPYSV